MPLQDRFAPYPSAFAYKTPDRKPNGKPAGDVVDDLLWGDWAGLYVGDQAEEKNDFCRVRIRGRDAWMEKEDLTEERLLEIIFVDIGQGDGCFMVTPDDKWYVIDAGQGDNMYRFLRWRFNLRNQDEPINFKGGVITHPDSDHYGGFRPLFEEENIHFETIYHNGIMERSHRSKSKQLGPKVNNGDEHYLTELVRNKAELERFLDSDLPGRSKYPGMLRKGIKNSSFDEFERLDTTTNGGFLPGYEADQPLSMQILGPVTEEVNGERLLRWFKDKGKTKNGHSVVFKLTYGNVRILLGGDLNIPSELLLLTHHTGAASVPSDLNEDDDSKYAKFIEKARETFEVDVAKSCHHGSADFFRPYLAATNPIVTVISSGDEESHSHPRADTLGTIGKYSRGIRSLVFNTELARSTRERMNIPESIQKRIAEIAVAINDHQDRLDEVPDDQEEPIKTEIKRLEKERESLWMELGRSVEVYGAINLRTDGKRIVMAQKLEKKRGDTEWDIYKLEGRRIKTADGQQEVTDFVYVSKFEEAERRRAKALAAAQGHD